jgi:hypothetical protein
VIEPVVAQAGGFCDASMSFTDYLTAFQFIQAVTCTYTGAAGFFVAGLLFYGGIGTAIYVRTGSIVIPTILILLTGGAVLSQVAAPGVQVAALVVTVVGAGAITYLYYRYSR